MDTKELLKITEVAGRLKDVTRHCYTPGGRKESVAEHTFRMTLMAYFVKDEFPDADINKVIKMCLIHDLGEAFTGDIPSFDKTKEDEIREETLLFDWVSTLPEPYSSEMKALYVEMAKLETLEAKIYKAMDATEAVISHNESSLSMWSENEFALNLVYGEDKTEFSEYLTKFRALLKEESEKKIANSEK